jgi:hypothetical protein
MDSCVSFPPALEQGLRDLAIVVCFRRLHEDQQNRNRVLHPGVRLCRRCLGRFGANGFTPNGFTPNGFTPNGFTPNGFTPNGFTPNGFTPNGFTPNGFTPNGFTPNGHRMEQCVSRVVSGGALKFDACFHAVAPAGEGITGRVSRPGAVPRGTAPLQPCRGGLRGGKKASTYDGRLS